MKRLKNFLENVSLWRSIVKFLKRPFFSFFFGDRLKNLCDDLFFFFFFLESTCACVLGPWPRAFLSLASRVSVPGKAVLGLGLGFFCVLGLKPCVLDSTSENNPPCNGGLFYLHGGLFYSQISFCYRYLFFFRTTVLLGGSSVKKLTELYDLTKLLCFGLCRYRLSTKSFS